MIMIVFGALVQSPPCFSRAAYGAFRIPGRLLDGVLLAAFCAMVRRFSFGRSLLVAVTLVFRAFLRGIFNAHPPAQMQLLSYSSFPPAIAAFVTDFQERRDRF